MMCSWQTEDRLPGDRQSRNTHLSVLENSVFWSSDIFKKSLYVSFLSVKYAQQPFLFVLLFSIKTWGQGVSLFCLFVYHLVQWSLWVLS